MNTTERKRGRTKCSNCAKRAIGGGTHRCLSAVKERQRGKVSGVDGNAGRQKHAVTGRQGRETDRKTDAAGQVEQAMAPVESAYQQSSNCRVMVDSSGGMVAVGEDKKGRNVAEITW